MNDLALKINGSKWFIVAGCLCSILIFWTYGCESKCKSLLSSTEKINRNELEAEIEYLARLAEDRISDLNKQDEIKQQLLDAANILSTTGQINPSGLLNLAATIGAISWGLNRNQKYKNALKSITGAET